MVPVSWQWIQEGLEDSVMDLLDVTKELDASGMNDIGKWWLLSKGNIKIKGE